MRERMTREQYKAVADITRYCEHAAENILMLMQHHGLDKVDGMQFSISVDPKFKLSTKAVTIGAASNMETGRIAGYCLLASGEDEEKYAPIGTNSPEYERIFASDELKERMREIRNAEKPLPPDGLWLSAYDDFPAVADRGYVR